MIKSVVFDIGDTLVLSTEGFKKTLNSKTEYNILKEIYPAITEEKYLEAIEKAKLKMSSIKGNKKYQFGLPNYLVQKELGVAPNWRLAKKMAKAFFNEQLKCTKLMPNARNILKYLKKKKIILGIISNADEKKATMWLKKFKITNFFSIIIISTQTQTEKSGLAPYKNYSKALNKYNITPKETLMVGNNLKEDTSAKLLDFNTAILTKYIEYQDFNIKPDFIIDNLIEIKTIMEKLNDTKNTNSSTQYKNTHWKKTSSSKNKQKPK